MIRHKHLRFISFFLMLILTAGFTVSASYPMPVQTVKEDESVYLFDLDTGKVILEQNADSPRCIASLTKMVTALLMIENQTDFEETVKVPESLSQELKNIQNTYGTGIDLRTGEEIRRIDLLYALLLPSANDAASVIAVDTAGSIDSFVSMMNAKAISLGCEHTTFTCAHGLYDSGNESTARDLAKIAAACHALPQFMETVETQSYTLPATNMHSEEREILSTNFMMNPEYEYYRSYIHGMKTGFTTQAGRCFITFAEKDGHTYGLIVLGSTKEEIFKECAEILDWVFDTFDTRVLVDTDVPVTTVPLKNSRKDDHIDLFASEPVSGYGHPEDKTSLRFNLPDFVRASVKEGRIIGTASVLLDGYEVGTVDLIVHRSYFSDLYTDLHSLLYLTPCLLLLIAVLGFITILCGKQNRRKRVKRRPSR